MKPYSLLRRRSSEKPTPWVLSSCQSPMGYEGKQHSLLRVTDIVFLRFSENLRVSTRARIACIVTFESIQFNLSNFQIYGGKEKEREKLGKPLWQS